MTPDSVYDKLRMFNGQAASWAWYGAAAPGATHLGLPTGPPTHPALTHPFQANREILEDKKPGTDNHETLTETDYDSPDLKPHSFQQPNTFINLQHLSTSFLRI